MNSTKTLLISSIIVVISSAMTISLVEIGLRLFDGSDGWSETSKANIIRNKVFEYDLNGLYPSTSNKVNYVRNEYGLRDNCNNLSEISILSMGGSTTDQRYVEFDSTYQSVIQKRLRDKFSNFGCVTNAGVDGHSTWGHLFAFENWFNLMPEMSPKYVLLYVGINDAYFGRTNTPTNGYDNLDRDSFKGWLKQFRIVQRIMPIYQLIMQINTNRNTVYGGHMPNKFSLQDYSASKLHPDTKSLTLKNSSAFRDRMVKILSYIEDMDAKPICVTQPHRYVIEIDGELRGIDNMLGEGFSGLDYDYSIRALNNVMLELCNDYYLDLYSQSYKENHFYDGAHTTAKGSIYIGNLMADFIIAKYSLEPYN